MQENGVIWLSKGLYMEIESIAQRLDGSEKLKVKYRLPVKGEDGSVVWQERSDKLLDVDIERKMLYVAFQGNSVIWVKADEVVSVDADDGVYG